MGRRRTTKSKHKTSSGAKSAEPERLVTIREACQRLTISRTTLHTLKAELPILRLTMRRSAIREADLLAFIHRRAGAA